jgi:hypothetical protein
MKRILLTTGLLLAISTAPALAGQCKDDIAKIDGAMTTAKIDADQKQEVSDLREQAVQLCGAGNEEAAVDVTAQAKTILSIE